MATTCRLPMATAAATSWRLGSIGKVHAKWMSDLRAPFISNYGFDSVGLLRRALHVRHFEQRLYHTSFSRLLFSISTLNKTVYWFIAIESLFFFLQLIRKYKKKCYRHKRINLTCNIAIKCHFKDYLSCWGFQLTKYMLLNPIYFLKVFQIYRHLKYKSWRNLLSDQ